MDLLPCDLSLVDPSCLSSNMKSSREDHDMAFGGKSAMAWTKPRLTEIACGMEINMYAPAEDEPVLF